MKDQFRIIYNSQVLSTVSTSSMRVPKFLFGEKCISFIGENCGWNFTNTEF